VRGQGKLLLVTILIVRPRLKEQLPSGLLLASMPEGKTILERPTGRQMLRPRLLHVTPAHDSSARTSHIGSHSIPGNTTLLCPGMWEE
jgi:hypothetical protein